MQRNRISFLFAPIAIVVLFFSTWVGKDRLAFRDVSHFYTPLYDYVDARTSQQWLPLWNPLDQTGVPLLGESTTAVLYPIRAAVYALPLSSEQAIAFYVAIHLILAAFTASWLALQTGATRLTAPLSGLTYTFSGGVFFLYTNPPFLAGAAWLPLLLGAFFCNDKNPEESRSLHGRRKLIAAFSMSMMVLAGDPQCALHACLVTSGFVLVNLVRRWYSSEKVLDRELRSRIAVLLTACLLTAMMTMPQLAASVSWSRQSERVQSNDSQAWHAPPLPGSQRDKVFHFSLPPWHLAELVTPNAWGRLFPVNHRISRSLPGDGRMWTPTIYLGMIG